MPRVSRKPRPTPFVQDRPSQWQVVRRRLRRTLAPVAVGFALVLVLGAGAGEMHAFNGAARFRQRLGDATGFLGLRVRQIVIDGQQKTPEDQLRTAIGATVGDPILGFSVADARARIEAIKWVQSAIVTRRLPDTIAVHLVERSPFAVWQRDGKFVLIDRQGQIVTDSDVAAFASQLPLVVGIGAPDAAATLIDELDQQPEIQSRFVAAVRVGERRWNLRLKSGMDVLLPEGAEVAALQRLAELQQTQKILDRPLEVLDMRLPDRLVFRPQPARAGESKDAQPIATRKAT